MSLKKNDIGCHVGSHFCGAFGYEDDIMLLSPSVSILQNMLDCCSEFASTYNDKFNPSKSKCITFSQKENIGSPELYMIDVKLDNVQLVKHLGHIITSDLTDDKDIMHHTSMYNRKANAVLSDFKKHQWRFTCTNYAILLQQLLWITVMGLIQYVYWQIKYIMEKID